MLISFFGTTLTFLTVLLSTNGCAFSEARAAGAESLTTVQTFAEVLNWVA